MFITKQKATAHLKLSSFKLEDVQNNSKRVVIYNGTSYRYIQSYLFIVTIIEKQNHNHNLHQYEDD
jgi:hypothetical protein